MLGRKSVADRLAALPAAVKRALEPALAREASALVDAMKRAAPVEDALEAHPGGLRDSLHVAPAKRELSVRIVADARDEQGHVFAAHVEFGHLSQGGTHVPARPFFFPVWRANRRAIKRRLSTVSRKAIKALFPKEAT